MTEIRETNRDVFVPINLGNQESQAFFGHEL